MDRYILPMIPRLDKLLLNHIAAKHISKSLVLDFVEGEEVFHGRVPWENKIKQTSMKLLTSYTTLGD